MKKITLLFLLILSINNVQAETNIQSFSASKAVDLTHVMHEDMALWPGRFFKKETLATYDKEGYLSHEFVMSEGAGTNVDAPVHFIKGSLSIDKLPINQLILPIVVIDIKTKANKNPDYELSLQDVLSWESKHGPIPANSLVALNSGWHSRFDSPKQYINMDSEKVMHFPGYSPDAAKLLIERNVSGIGTDTLSLDHGPSKTFATHVVILKANKYMIESMANLDALPTVGATVIIGMLPIRDGSQAPARIFALLP